MPDLRDVVVLEDETLEFDFGWVIFYNTEAFAKGQNWRDTLVGNAPFIVDRTTGQLFQTGTAQPIEVYVGAYKRYGDPHARPGKGVRVSGWDTGALAVSAIKVVRARSGSSLTEAKRCVEQVLNGGSASFEADSVDAAAAAVNELHACGFRAEQLRDARAA
jgi:ribosomal protein L7/L12